MQFDHSLLPSFSQKNHNLFPQGNKSKLFVRVDISHLIHKLILFISNSNSVLLDLKTFNSPIHFIYHYYK